VEKTVSSVGSTTRLQELEARAVLRVHEQMVHPDGKRKDQQHDKGEPTHGIAVHPAAGRQRHQRIKGNVSRHQPEIDDGVQSHRKQRAPECRVDQVAPTEGPRQQDAKQFDQHTRGSPRP
jgi:hypothetical protein